MLSQFGASKFLNRLAITREREKRIVLFSSPAGEWLKPVGIMSGAVVLSPFLHGSCDDISNIPAEAFDYVVNGKPALEWVMERQVVKTDKDSGIVNDANDYANETVGDPRYPLQLFQRVITVSLETMKIVNSLPALDID